MKRKKKKERKKKKFFFNLTKKIYAYIFIYINTCIHISRNFSGAVAVSVGSVQF